jgi:hypothetical protein
MFKLRCCDELEMGAANKKGTKQKWLGSVPNSKKCTYIPWNCFLALVAFVES